MSEKDNLEKIFEMRETYMKLLQSKFKDSYPNWPLDLSTKKSQSICRQTALNGVEEMFEALGHLKNWKKHRSTDVPDFDKEEFLEEIVDAYNYFFTLLILADVSSEDFFKAFCKKDEIIRKRIHEGY